MADETATLPIPETSDVGAETLQLVRELKSRGLFVKLNEKERANLLLKSEPAMALERQKLLKPINEIVAEPEKPDSFVDQLLAPARAAIQNPGAAVLSAARGVERGLNPLPLVNLVNKLNPFSEGDLIEDDLETFESLFNFPVIRGAELAARLFVDEDKRPPLTTFAQVVENQRSLDKELRAAVPGVQEGAELGAAGAGAVATVSTGLKFAKALARGAPKAVKSVAVRIKTAKAAKATKKADKLARKLLKEGDGPFMNAILNRPEKVKALVDQSSDLTINDVAIQLKDELELVGVELGKRVGKFRDAAFADTTTRVPISQALPDLIDLLDKRTTFQGASVLPSKIKQQLDSAKRLSDLGVTTPNQAMVWIDVIDDIIDFGNSGKSGSNAIKNANVTLSRMRAVIKDSLRQVNKHGLSKAAPIEKSLRSGPAGIKEIGRTRREIAFQLWADADDAFSQFVNESNGLIRRLESDSGESLVANLFNKNKTPLRSRLERSLSFMEKLDPTAQGHGAAFFDRLAEIKAASKIKGVKLQIADPIQDNMTNIVKEWTRRGERIGAAAGTTVGGGVGFVTGGTGVGGLSGGAGFVTGRALGGEVGNLVGKMLGNPDRILKQAMKAKALSEEARKLARDMAFVSKNFGPEGVVAFMDLVGPIPAVNQLIKFSNSRTNEEKERGK